MTTAQLETLRKEYSKINSIDPCKPTYKKLCKFLDECDDNTLKQLRDAKIKWVSGMALTRCLIRNIHIGCLK